MMRLLLALVALVLPLAPAAARPLVAVIDSGVARTPELDHALVGEHDLAGDRPAYRPRYDHGTMVATILNREARGAIDILSLRIDDPAGCPAGRAPPCQPSPLPIVRAIDTAIDLRVDAINLSLSLADDPRITAAVVRAAKAGIIVVMAAGNAGRDRPDNLAMAEAGTPFTVLVGATDSSGHPWSGSNRPRPDDDGLYVWRPGVAVPTRNATDQVVFGTGTSFAAPIETARRVLARAAEPVLAAGTH